MIAIERQTAAEAWAALFSQVLGQGGTAVNAITSWTTDAENPLVEAALDDFVQSRPGGRGPRWPVLTVANTIFASELYDPDLGTEALAQFCEWYLEGLEASQPASPGGEYCQRIVAWPSDDGTHINQLMDAAAKLQKFADPAQRKYNYSSNYEIGVEHPMLDLRTHMPGRNLDPYGFPCLSHISLTADRSKTVHLTAMYRNQHLVQKAYGNYLGLTRLLGALCHHTGLGFGSVTVVATHADSEQGSTKGYGKGDIEKLSRTADALTGRISTGRIGSAVRQLASAAASISAPRGSSIGVDAVDISGFSDDFGFDADVLSSAFSEEELSECQGDMERLAGKFAVKEAVAKAVGIGFRDPLDPTTILVRSAPNGRPSVVLTDEAVTAVNVAGYSDFSCSLSHEDGLAIAVVVAFASEEAADER